MQKLVRIIPFFILKFACAQDKFIPKVEFGFNSGTYAGLCINNILMQGNNDRGIRKGVQPQQRIKYGWEQGFFLWIDVSPVFSFKPGINIGQCVTDHLNGNPHQKNSKVTYSNAFCTSMQTQFIVKLGRPDTHPIVKAAKCMSYYMLSRQAYLIMGPKVTYCKNDRSFEVNNKSLNYTLGTSIGAGINNAFQNMNVAPEFYVSVDVAPEAYNGNMLSMKNYMLSATVCANFF